MGRNRKYATPEEAHEAKLAQAREKYRLSRVGVERKKWGFINTVITEDMIGKTIKELELEYKAQHPSKAKAKKAAENESKQDNAENDIVEQDHPQTSPSNDVNEAKQEETKQDAADN